MSDWRSCSMAEALRFADGKQINHDLFPYVGPAEGCEVVWFQDGSAVACASDVEYYPGHSDMTPSWTELNAPKWWIMEA